jgi:glutamyl-tRNA reductase
MSELRFLHQAGISSENFEDQTSSILVWKTCRRQILFLQDDESGEVFNAEIFSGAEAEKFLAEVLCGLQSPLLGETEVFGQFKAWWKNLPDDLPWKRLHRSRIESLFSLVKSVREQVLCGSGSQSYGSLLRRFLPQQGQVELLGAGHLVQELLPWLQNKKTYRLWCRTPSKIDFAHEARAVTAFSEISKLENLIVVAAPLTHDELNAWLQERGFSSEHSLFDLRSDSSEFEPFVRPLKHYTLQDFSSRREETQKEQEELLSKSRNLIGRWNEEQKAKSQIRPYGWDDL